MEEDNLLGVYDFLIEQGEKLGDFDSFKDAIEEEPGRLIQVHNYLKNSGQPIVDLHSFSKGIFGEGAPRLHDSYLNSKVHLDKVEEIQTAADEAFRTGNGTTWADRRKIGAKSALLTVLEQTTALGEFVTEKTGFDDAAAGLRKTREEVAGAKQKLNAEISSNFKGESIQERVDLFLGEDGLFNKDGKGKKVQVEVNPKTGAFEELRDKDDLKVKASPEAIKQFNDKGFGKVSFGGVLNLGKVNPLTALSNAEQGIYDLVTLVAGSKGINAGVQGITKAFTKGALSGAAKKNIARATVGSMAAAQSFAANYEESLKLTKGNVDKAMNIAAAKSAATGAISLIGGLEAGLITGKSAIATSLNKETTKYALGEIGKKELLSGFLKGVSKNAGGEVLEELVDKVASNSVEIISGYDKSFLPSLDEAYEIGLGALIVSSPFSVLNNTNKLNKDGLVARSTYAASKHIDTFTDTLEKMVVEMEQNENVTPEQVAQFQQEAEAKIERVTTIRNDLEAAGDLSEDQKVAITALMLQRNNLVNQQERITDPNIQQRRQNQIDDANKEIGEILDNPEPEPTTENNDPSRFINAVPDTIPVAGPVTEGQVANTQNQNSPASIDQQNNVPEIPDTTTQGEAAIEAVQNQNPPPVPQNQAAPLSPNPNTQNVEPTVNETVNQEETTAPSGTQTTPNTPTTNQTPPTPPNQEPTNVVASNEVQGVRLEIGDQITTNNKEYKIQKIKDGEVTIDDGRKVETLPVENELVQGLLKEKEAQSVFGDNPDGLRGSSISDSQLGKLSEKELSRRMPQDTLEDVLADGFAGGTRISFKSFDSESDANNRKRDPKRQGEKIPIENYLESKSGKNKGKNITSIDSWADELANDARFESIGQDAIRQRIVDFMQDPTENNKEYIQRRIKENQQVSNEDSLSDTDVINQEQRSIDQKARERIEEREKAEAEKEAQAIIDAIAEQEQVTRLSEVFQDYQDIDGNVDYDNLEKDLNLLEESGSFEPRVLDQFEGINSKTLDKIRKAINETNIIVDETEKRVNAKRESQGSTNPTNPAEEAKKEPETNQNTESQADSNQEGDSKENTGPSTATDRVNQEPPPNEPPPVGDTDSSANSSDSIIKGNHDHFDSIREEVLGEKADKPSRKKFDMAVQEAFDKGYISTEGSDFTNELVIADKIINTEYIASDAEIIALAGATGRIKDSIKLAKKDAIALRDSKQFSEATQRSNYINELEGKLDRLTRAGRLTGTYTARALAIRAKYFNYNKYEAVNIINSIKNVSKNAKITKKERREIDVMAEKIKILEEELVNARQSEINNRNNQMAARTAANRKLKKVQKSKPSKSGTKTAKEAIANLKNIINGNC